MFVNGLLSTADSGVYGVLQHDVAVIDQEFSELGSDAALFFGFDREVEKHH